MIHEVIVTTFNKKKEVHIAPMGVKFVDFNNKQCVQISPFKPSQTLNNLIDTKVATINYVDNVKVFAGIVTEEKKSWDLNQVSDSCVPHLDITNTYMNVNVCQENDDEVRPNIICNIENTKILRPFMGFNRAQFSVIELAVLSTRLGRIEDDKVKREYEYLKIGIDKTAGEDEKAAWKWIENKIMKYFNND